MKKRILSAFMALCLVLTLLPVSTLAAEEATGESEPVISQDGADTPAVPIEESGKQENGTVGEPDASGAPNEPEENEPTKVPEEPAQEPGPAESVGEPDTMEPDMQTEDPAEDSETAAEEPVAESAVYVSKDGSDDGDGTKETPYATLAKAVDAALDGDTIYLLSNLEIGSLAFIDKKAITIDGQGHTVTRADTFERKNDGRGGYNPAMIEVANGAELTLLHITLDDALKTAEENLAFLEQPTGGSDKNNESKVQDAIIAAYMNGGTIILGYGATLKNFGGMSAVRIGGPGQGGVGTSTLIMKSGSQIIDDSSKSRKGGVAAVWSQGGKLVMEEGSEISGIDGRAIYLEDGGIATVYGSIEDITANSVMTLHPATGNNLGSGASNDGFAGIAVAALGNSTFTLGENGTITRIASNDNNSADVATFITSLATFAMDTGSTISDIQTIGLMDANGGHVFINGTVRGCHTNKVFFRIRGGSNYGGDFTLGEQGVITDSSTTDAGIIYVQHGTPEITIAGEISDCQINSSGAIFMTQNGIHDGTCIVTGTIKNISGPAGYAITVDGPSKVYINGGTISGCSNYAIRYKGYSNSLLQINDGTIEGNHNGGAQIQVTYASGISATDALQHVKIAPGTIKGNKTIDLPYSVFDVTLDEDYTKAALGQANSAAVTAIKTSIQSDWTVVGSGALWFQPSGESIHFTASRPSNVKNTGLFAAYILLDENGTPQTDAEAKLVEVDNADPIDVTLTDLTPGQSYALMFVNNNEYTLAPDDITIYTGGGQGQETSNSGFPALTITNSVDEIKSLTIDGQEQSGNLMAALLQRLEVTYTDKNGDPVTNDAEAGEYIATLFWKEGQQPNSLRINGNEVAGDFDTGTLIVRHTEDIEEAIEGTNTYELLKEEPDEAVEHAEAIAKKSPMLPSMLTTKFYTNDDESREVDAAGIQLLDDSLLIDDDGTDRQALLEQKAEELLPSAGEGKAYRYEFHYLDLVDAYNGNAWVSASYGTTVYLPYPGGVTADTADDFGVQVIHFPGLHREYGIAGQAEVEEAIEACEPETMEVEYNANGIKFDVSKAGFSPFAVVWQEDARTFTISATAGAGGSISPSGSVFVAEGSDKVFTITPNSGYHIADVQVDGISVGAVSTYTFTDVAANHTISATFQSTGGTGGGGTGSGKSDPYLRFDSNGGTAFAPIDGHGSAFTINPYDDDEYGTHIPTRPGYRFTGWYRDSRLNTRVDEDDTIRVTGSMTLFAGWEETSVPDLLNGDDHYAYIQGYADGTVRPNANITRAQVATIFFRLLDEDVRDDYLTTTNRFPDVNEDYWANTAISTMAALGIINGRNNGMFDPNAYITRGEFAAICARFDDSDVISASTFSDISGYWAENEIRRAAALGWVQGFGDGTYRPNENITRAQAVTMINRVLCRQPEEADDLLPGMNTWSDCHEGDWYYLAIQEAGNSHDYVAKDGYYESWTELNAAPDWSRYE